MLILGTFPSPKSREFGFYYGHPQNIFWQTLARVLNQPEPAKTIAARREFLLKNHIAMWDVLHACEINGAADSSITNPVPNKFALLLAKTNIVAVLTTGKTATDLFQKLCAKEAGMDAIYLPSTSPANRALQAKPEFMRTWQQIVKSL
ncbi:DNA-deoxyinosine glycosylase [Candidatus Saccharibacteria bacterium]|nr:DNA-deoxyinosine glycosylase [Candidatus Saccharibacteria bacterium]